MNKKAIVTFLVIITMIGVGCAPAVVTEEAVKEDMTTKVMAEEMTSEEMEKEEMTSEEMAKEAMSEGDQMTNPGVPAPAFSLMNLKGNTVELSALQGEKVYVKFWASWCSICLAGLEELDELSTNSEGFKVITIVSPGINGEQPKEDFIKWFEGLGYQNIEVLLDESGDLVKEFGIRAYPTSAYIGSDGVLVKVQPGHMTNEMVTEFFKGIY